VPDPRKHRGPHPRDTALFSVERTAALRRGTADLSWLLTRGYADKAALKLVGDHLQLQRRQRLAVMRAACSDAARAHRRATRRPVADARVAVDGFNVLITVEAALSGAVLLRGRDGLLRDMSSIHGTYRRVAETADALGLLVAELAGAEDVCWYLDRPVSNSGRVAAAIREHGMRVELVDSADTALAGLSQSGWVGATADGPLLDRLAGGVDLTSGIVSGMPDAWLVDLSQCGEEIPSGTGSTGA